VLRNRTAEGGREEALLFFRSEGRRSWNLLTRLRFASARQALAAAIRGWQSQPRSDEKRVLQMLLAIPLQSLGPPFEFFLFVRQRSSDPGRLARRPFQQGKRRAQTGRFFLQFCVERCQRSIFAGQISENP